jgi:hypothetical protein
MPFRFHGLSLFLLPALAFAQPTLPPPPPPQNVLQGAWDYRLANGQAEQWRLRNAAGPPDAQARLHFFLAERDALLSTNNGSLRPADRAELQDIADGMRSEAPDGFEQHLAAYYLKFPGKAAFHELDAAAAMDPERAELASPLLTRAQLAGDVPALGLHARRLMQQGGVAPALLTAAADVLLCLPDQAILFTNGDMDGQPLLVQQFVHGLHPTVLVVDRRLLTQEAYRARVWAQVDARGSAPADGPGFAHALLAATDRPIYFALGLDHRWLAAFPDQLQAVGAAFHVAPPSDTDAAQLERDWANMKKPLDAGPISRNYLLPGSVLLARYRAEGRNAQAQALAAELRRMAQATGALDDLERSGVLTR